MLEILLGVIGALLLWLFLKSRQKHNFWKERGFPYVEPFPVFGSSFKTLTFQQNQAGLYNEIYNTYKDKAYIGIYEMTQPVLIVRDPSLIGKVLVKDFNNFADHGFGEVPDTEVDRGLFVLKGDEWRAVRHKMVPVFTTGKLRNMFPQMLSCSNKLLPLIDAQLEDVDIMEVSTAYTMSVIASCAFGIDVETGKDSEFRKMGNKVFRLTNLRYLKFILIIILPYIAKILKISFTEKDVAEYFSKIIKDTFRYRKENNIVRNDVVQMLMQLKEQGNVEVHTKDKEDDYLIPDETSKNVKNIEMTDNLLISQAFTFITAGFEGMTINIMYTLFELTQNPELQTRARDEIERVVAKYGGLTYESLKEATFLSSCLDEALRKYPLAPTVFRGCTKKYEIEEGLFIDPGTKVVISVNGIHNDPQLWSNPEKFDPDRFGRDYITPNTYLPFGSGPRMCIAMRFALLEIKLGIAVILYNYKISMSPKTKLPFKMEVRSFFTQPKDTLYFNFEKINL